MGIYLFSFWLTVATVAAAPAQQFTISKDRSWPFGSAACPAPSTPQHALGSLIVTEENLSDVKSKTADGSWYLGDYLIENIYRAADACGGQEHRALWQESEQPVG
jgi:hypothetical protein